MTFFLDGAFKVTSRICLARKAIFPGFGRLAPRNLFGETAGFFFVRPCYHAFRAGVDAVGEAPARHGSRSGCDEAGSRPLITGRKGGKRICWTAIEASNPVPTTRMVVALPAELMAVWQGYLALTRLSESARFLTQVIYRRHACLLRPLYAKRHRRHRPPAGCRGSTSHSAKCCHCK